MKLSTTIIKSDPHKLAHRPMPMSTRAADTVLRLITPWPRRRFFLRSVWTCVIRQGTNKWVAHLRRCSFAFDNLIERHELPIQNSCCVFVLRDGSTVQVNSRKQPSAARIG